MDEAADHMPARFYQDQRGMPEHLVRLAAVNADEGTVGE